MQLPASDCEAIREGLVAQPVNTLTAGAHLVAGGWLLSRAAAAVSPTLARAYALAVAALGAGSLWYHAGGPAARWVHDVALVLPPAVLVVGSTLAVLRGGAGFWHRSEWAPRARALAVGAGALVAAAPFQVWGRTGGPLCLGGAVPAHGIWHVLTAVALAAAGVAVVEPLAVAPRAPAGEDPVERPGRP